MVTDVATVSPSRFVQLLADEQRWRLLQELVRSDRKVSELTELLGRPQNLVSYHLASLRNAGIVSARRSSADRRDTYYRIEMRRCADLLCGVGSALQPGLRLDVVAPGPWMGARLGGDQACSSSARETVLALKWPKRFSSITLAVRSELAARAAIRSRYTPMRCV